VAGAAFVFRQYLTDGWHPRGVKNVSNSMHARPSSALLKPCLSILRGPPQGPWLRTHMKLSLQLVCLVFHGYSHLLIFLCLGFNAAPHIPILLPVQTNMKDLAVQNCTTSCGLQMQKIGPSAFICDKISFRWLGLCILTLFP
jgi:hypothetical protein